MKWLTPLLMMICWMDAGAAEAPTGMDIYRQACVMCHGAAGQPDPDSPVVKAFDPEPADLSDPLFNSREPAADWFMVVKHGGYAMGLSAQMPAQKDTLSDAEIQRVVDYIKTFADTDPYPPGELNLMLPIRTKKAFPEDEVVWKSRLTDRDGEDEFRNVIEFEKRVGNRGQLVLEMVHSDNGTDSDFREVEVGYKHAFAYNRNSLWSAAAVVALPLDGGDNEFVPYLAYARIINDGFTFQGSAKAKIPVSNSDEGELELAGVVHSTWSPWPRRVFPAMALTATIPFEDGGGDSVKFTALPQVRIGLTRGGHVALNLGVEVPLSDKRYDTRFHLTLLWDFADGGFSKGW